MAHFKYINLNYSLRIKITVNQNRNGVQYFEISFISFKGRYSENS